MNKKVLIPILLCVLVAIALIFTCSGESKKVKLSWEAIPTPAPTADSIHLKVYVENSGSMDAYMCLGSNLKDAIFDYVSDVQRLCASSSLYYINSQVIPYEGNLNSYIKDLTPQAFVKAGGDRSNTDLMTIMNTMLESLDANTVSVFVSDCILDVPQNASNFFGNCQVSIKNSFSEALSRIPNLGVEIIKLESKVDGYWYCGSNKEYLTDVKRPYYIWVIGDTKYLAKFNEQYPVENIIGGIKAYSAYTTPQTIPFDLDKSTYTTNHTGKINVEILANLRGTLQGADVIARTSSYRVESSQSTITSIEKISDNNRRFSHVIGLQIESPTTLGTEKITFSYPHIAAWVANSDDVTGQDVQNNLDKTTGLMALVKGVAEAYKNYTTCGSISFELTNK